MEYSQYINAELLTLVPVMNVIGYWLKSKTKLKNSLIPIVLTCISVIACTAYTLGTEPISAQAVISGAIQGVLVAASSVYTNQLYKQMKGGDGNGS